MPDWQPEAVQVQLEQILRSPGFARNERLSGFLRFVIQRHLEGRDSELKESVIGTEVFGRKPDYNPKSDPVVRTEARRLRARVAAYYEGAGASDAIRIELPKGAYVPLIRRVPETGAVERPQWPWFRWMISVLACVIVVIAITGWARWFPGRGALRSKTNAVAFNFYLHARSLEMQPAARDVAESIGLFEQAIANDPSFAPAYAGIAAGYATRSAFDRFDLAERAGMISKGWAAAETAFRLDPQSADAYDALGMMQAREGLWQDAERSFRRAIELAPRDPLWRGHFALFLLLPIDRVDDAIRQLRTAEELDPHFPLTNAALSQALQAAGKPDEAERYCYSAAQNDQERSICWAKTLLRQGKVEQAVQILETIWSGRILEPGADILGIAYAKASRRADAERIAAVLPRPGSKVRIFAALGDKDRTFEILDQMIPMGPARIGRDLISPNFAFLRGDPRLSALRKRAGLPE